MFNFQGFINFELFKKWCHQESNRGHKDFQSFALPTFSFAGAKISIFFNTAITLEEIFANF